MSAVKDLVEIKTMIDKSNVPESDKTVMQKMRELEKKVDSMKESFQRGNPLNKSPVKIKRKREIIKLLEGHKKLTSTQLSIITGVSRTRCNEYLRELEEEGMAKGTINDKKKFYRLVRWQK